LRAPRSIADALPDTALPPPPSTPMSANWEPPLNISTDNAQVCTTDRPAEVPSAP
jgi:hypothetical protein